MKHRTSTRRDEWRSMWENRKAAFVEQTWRRMMRDMTFARLHCYYIPTEGNAWGELLALADGEPIPERAELVSQEPIPAGTQQHIAAWLNRYADWLSVIPANY